MTKNKTLFGLSIIAVMILGSAALTPQAFAGVTPCQVPVLQNWTINQNCTLTNSSVITGNVTVENNSVLLIPNDVTLTITSGSDITIKSGSGILIKFGGVIVVLNNVSGGIVSCAEINFVRTLDDFYTKCSTDSGMIVASSDEVPDEALFEMNRIIIKMTELHPEVTDHLNQHGIIAGVMGANQVTTDMPEHSDLNVVFPDIDWDTRARGLGATFERPLVSTAEENLLCYLSDPYGNGQSGGESISIHEFSHTLFEYGLVNSSPQTFNPYTQLPQSYWPGGSGLFTELQSIYTEALAQGRWQDTYASTNWTEFFAVGSQVYFDANDRTFDYEFDMNREGLVQYEPNLASLLETIYPVDWRYSCPN